MKHDNSLHVIGCGGKDQCTHYYWMKLSGWFYNSAA